MNGFAYAFTGEEWGDFYDQNPDFPATDRQCRELDEYAKEHDLPLDEAWKEMQEKGGYEEEPPIDEDWEEEAAIEAKEKGDGEGTGLIIMTPQELIQKEVTGKLTNIDTKLRGLNNPEVNAVLGAVAGKPRVDSYPPTKGYGWELNQNIGIIPELNTNPDTLLDTYLEEARHAYQTQQAKQPGNDPDGDGLATYLTKPDGTKVSFDPNPNTPESKEWREYYQETEADKWVDKIIESLPKDFLKGVE